MNFSNHSCEQRIVFFVFLLVFYCPINMGTNNTQNNFVALSNISSLWYCLMKQSCSVYCLYPCKYRFVVYDKFDRPDDSHFHYRMTMSGKLLKCCKKWTILISIWKLPCHGREWPHVLWEGRNLISKWSFRTYYVIWIFQIHHIAIYLSNCILVSRDHRIDLKSLQVKMH